MLTDGNNVNLSKNIDKGLIQMMNQLKEEQRLQLLEEQSLDNDLEEEEAIESETLQEQQEESETDLDEATESESSKQDLTKELHHPESRANFRSKRLRGKPPEVTDIWWPSKSKEASAVENETSSQLRGGTDNNVIKVNKSKRKKRKLENRK